MLDLAILGAGPYGLSVAAHVRGLGKLSYRVFGEPMGFWDQRMPKGMNLRSPWDGSHLADPADELTLDSFVRTCGNHLPRPIPLDRFVDYGRWFQSRAVPTVDKRRILRIQRRGAGFLLLLEDGEELEARRVVIAAGVCDFAYVPEQFKGLDGTLVSHARDHGRLDCFSGRSVLVIGAGQSALELAALTHEAGARVEIVARRDKIRFLHRSNVLHKLGPLSTIMYAPADVGPAGVSRVAGAPGLYRHLPRRLHDALRLRCIRPAGSSWLQPRLRDVSFSLNAHVVMASEKGGRVEVLLNDGSQRVVDHVILGTGYRVDISRYDFLSSHLLAAIQRVQGFPRLSPWFESSVPGLHFVGASSAWSFGPLMQFVAGTRFTARRLARFLRSEGAPPRRT